ncbi:NAD(P)-dependent oxidoreductase [Phyllobacterium salinisoli]|nr:NAD(P)-dependent oxidoreductase [Phyllobacterium salinisoli]
MRVIENIGFRLQNRTANDGARIAPLSVLPLFISLKGKRALIAGGSAAAAWKAELLVMSGARVVVHATDDLSEEMTGLLAVQGSGKIVHRNSPWLQADWPAFAFAIADAANDDEAATFASAARAAGVPFNVIDKPAYCQFQFGSIVSRSPAVVSISTDGAAPILAQAIRRRIEAMLPQSLSAWADLAQRLRRAVVERLAPGEGRRRFWERFVDRAFAAEQGPSRSDERLFLEELSSGGSRPEAAHMTIVEVRSHDAELLPLKAVRALQAAEIILFDDNISTDMLQLARREAKRVAVTAPKEGNGWPQHPMTGNHEVGRRIVWLKSDAFRPGHEIAAWLRRTSVAVDIIPGIAPDPEENRRIVANSRF